MDSCCHLVFNWNLLRVGLNCIETFILSPLPCYSWEEEKSRLRLIWWVECVTQTSSKSTNSSLQKNITVMLWNDQNPAKTFLTSYRTVTPQETHCQKMKWDDTSLRSWKLTSHAKKKVLYIATSSLKISCWIWQMMKWSWLTLGWHLRYKKSLLKALEVRTVPSEKSVSSGVKSAWRRLIRHPNIYGSQKEGQPSWQILWENDPLVLELSLFIFAYLIIADILGPDFASYDIIYRSN